MPPVYDINVATADIAQYSAKVGRKLSVNQLTLIRAWLGTAYASGKHRGYMDGQRDGASRITSRNHDMGQ